MIKVWLLLFLNEPAGPLFAMCNKVYSRNYANRMALPTDFHIPCHDEARQSIYFFQILLKFKRQDFCVFAGFSESLPNTFVPLNPWSSAFEYDWL